MKKLMCILLALCMLFALCACAESGTSKDTPAQTVNDTVKEADTVEEATEQAGTKELVRWKMGCIDPGSWNATNGPVYDQLEKLQDALNFEIIWTTKASTAVDDVLAAIQNLIVAGADALIIGNDCSSCIIQTADICEEAGVYWSTYWTVISEEDQEKLQNYKYFVGTFYEDDVYAGEWIGNVLGELGSKKVCVIGTPEGAVITNQRVEGQEKAYAKYGMEVLASERDYTLTGSAAGGADIINRFLMAYPECDGILIAGRTHSCLAGVVTALAEAGKTENIPVACIDFNSAQDEYFQNGQLAGIIGGHHLGGMYNTILVCNILNGTPLTDEKVFMQDNYLEIDSAEESAIYQKNIAEDAAYYGDEILQFIKAYNPDVTFDDFVELVKSYSVQDVLDRHGVK